MWLTQLKLDNILINGREVPLKVFRDISGLIELKVLYRYDKKIYNFSEYYSEIICKMLCSHKLNKFA